MLLIGSQIWIFSGVWAGSRNCGFTALIAHYRTSNDHHQHWHCSYLWWCVIHLCPLKYVYTVMANNKRGNLLLSLVSYWSTRSQHMTGCSAVFCQTAVLPDCVSHPFRAVSWLQFQRRRCGRRSLTWIQFACASRPLSHCPQESWFNWILWYRSPSMTTVSRNPICMSTYKVYSRLAQIECWHW